MCHSGPRYQAGGSDRCTSSDSPQRHSLLPVLHSLLLLDGLLKAQLSLLGCRGAEGDAGLSYVVMAIHAAMLTLQGTWRCQP